MAKCYEPDRELTKSEDRILCNRCKHRKQGIICDAFLEGIPKEILRSGEHFRSVPGDNGIVCEPR